MGKMMLAKISLFLIFVTLISYAEEPVKKLHFNFNDNVTIWISNQPCELKKYKEKFPWSAKAVRKDGEVLEACFNGEGDSIHIQWEKGDHSIFPANYFLNNKNENNI